MAEAEADIAGISGDLATNAVEIAELEERVDGIATNYLPAWYDNGHHGPSIEGASWNVEGDVKFHGSEVSFDGLVSVAGESQAPYPYLLTPFYGLARSYGSWGRYLTVASAENICLATPYGWFLSRARSGTNHVFESSIPLGAPEIFLGNPDNRLEDAGGELVYGGQTVAMLSDVAATVAPLGARVDDAEDAIGELDAATNALDAAVGNLAGQMEDFLTVDDLPTASTSKKGLVQIGANLQVESGVVSVLSGTTSTQGIVRLASSATSTSQSFGLTPFSLNAFAQNAIFGATAYSSSKTYNAGDRIRSGYLFYECLVDGTKGIAPSTNSPNWRNMNIQGQIDAATEQAAGIAAEVGAVEARVEALEWPETCTLWVVTNLPGGGIYQIPTNFHTRNLELRIDRSGKIVASVLDTTWSPMRAVTISIFSYGQNGTNTVAFNGGTFKNVATQTATDGTGRLCTLSYDPAARQWRAHYIATGYSHVSYAMPDDGTGQVSPTAPGTVEEWEEMWLARKAGGGLRTAPAPPR